MSSLRSHSPALLLIACSCASTPLGNVSLDDEPGARPNDWAERLIDPVSAPTQFESPVVHSSLNGMVVHQELPSSSVFNGGDYQVYALQARWAVTERFALLATKDGYIDFNPDTGSSETGWADIAVGAKYAVVADEESGFLLTPGILVEGTNGSRDVFQGNGDGNVRPFVSAGWDLGELNLLAGFGFNLPLDDDEESTSYDYHLHASYELQPSIFPLLEVNGMTWTDDGDRLPFDFEGGDLINLGSTDVSGNTVITGAAGARFRASDSLYFGFAYEWPLTSREDLMDSRLTLDVLWHF